MKKPRSRPEGESPGSILSDQARDLALQHAQDLYSHVSPTLQAEAAMRFDQALARQAESKMPTAS